MNCREKMKAFTLVEVLVSLVLISIISFTSLMVFSNINSSSESIEFTIVKEEADLMLVDAVSEQLFYGQKRDWKDFEINRTFMAVPGIKNTGELKVMVTRNNKVVYSVHQFVSLDEK